MEIMGVSPFKYMGTWIISDGLCIMEIQNKIGQANTAFYNMKNISYNVCVDES